MTQIAHKTRLVFGIVCLSGVASLMWLAMWATVVPVIRGWSPVVVMSGSMGPGIETGDIVLAAPYDGRTVGPGTVIVFDNPTGEGLITHRVVAMTPSGDYVTRGDANGRIDSTPVPPESIHGVGQALVPGIGSPFVWFTNQQWLKLLATTVATLAAVWASRWSVLTLRNPVADDVRRSVSGVWPAPSPHDVRSSVSGVWPAPSPHEVPRRTRVVRCTLAAILGLAVLAWATTEIGTTDAAFAGSTSDGPNSFTNDTIAAPTALAANNSTPDQVDLSWTPTIDTYATGYNIYRTETSGSGYTYLDTVVGQATTAYIDDLCAGVPTTAPSFEAVTLQSEDPGASPISVTVPTDTASGDLLIATLATVGSSLPFNTPAGWTLLDSGLGGGAADVGTGIWYRVADGSEPVSYSFSWTGGITTDVVASMSRYSGVDPVAPINTWGVSTGSSTTPTAPSVTTTSENTTIVRVFGADDDPSGVTYPAGHTGRHAHWTGGLRTVTEASADVEQAAIGSAGTAAFTISATQSWRAVTLALEAEATSNCGGTNAAFEDLGDTEVKSISTTSMNLTVPAATAADDLLIAHVSTDAADPTFGTPTGWVLLVDANSGGSTTASTAVWYRVADGTEPASYTFTWLSSTNAVGALSRYSGVDPASPIDAWATNTGSSSSPSAPSVVTTLDDTIVLRIMAADGKRIPNSGSYPVGHNGRYELETTGFIANVSGAAADTLQAATGATGTASFSLSGSDDWVAATIALAPIPPPTYYYVLESHYENWASAYSNEAS